MAKKIDRRKFLTLGGSALAGGVLLGAGWMFGGEEILLASGGPRGGLVLLDPEPDRLPATVHVKVETYKGAAPGLLHLAEEATGAVIMIGSISGGVAGPSGVYSSLASAFQSAGITVLRLECRKLDDLEECVYDVLSAIDALRRRGVERFVLIGWSFGGAVMINAGVASDRVVGVATVASEIRDGTPETVKALAPKSLLLIHGSSDYVTPDFFSESLYNNASEPKELIIYDRAGHLLSEYTAEMREELFQWSASLLLG